MEQAENTKRRNSLLIMVTGILICISQDKVHCTLHTRRLSIWERSSCQAMDGEQSKFVMCDGQMQTYEFLLNFFSQKLCALLVYPAIRPTKKKKKLTHMRAYRWFQFGTLKIHSQQCQWCRVQTHHASPAMGYCCQMQHSSSSYRSCWSFFVTQFLLCTRCCLCAPGLPHTRTLIIM